jgi:hypothetical protein
MSNNVTSPSKVKKYMLEFAKGNRAHPFTRVSQDTLDKVEAKAREVIRAIVMSAPSKGKTL